MLRVSLLQLKKEKKKLNKFGSVRAINVEERIDLKWSTDAQ